MHWRKKWQPTPVFLPGESQGRRSLVGCRLWGRRVGHDWWLSSSSIKPHSIQCRTPNRGRGNPHSRKYLTQLTSPSAMQTKLPLVLNSLHPANTFGKTSFCFSMKSEIPKGWTLDMVRQHSCHQWTQWECFVSLTSCTPSVLCLPRLLQHAHSGQFSHSVVSDSETAVTAARKASLSIIKSRSLLKLMSIELVMPSNHLTLCGPLLLLPSIFPSLGVFSKWVSSSHQVAKGLEFQL